MSNLIPSALAKDWDDLVSVLPDDLEASAKTYGALRRRRGITTAASLLRLILIYATVLSLRLVAIWAVGLKVSDITRQALQKRIQHSTPWLRYLVTSLLHTLLELPAPTEGGGAIKRVLLRDASVIARPGSPGTEWRLHLSWSPFDQQPAQVTLTDEHTGEGLQDAGLQAGDLVIADRAHGIWRTIQVALHAVAFFIIRLTWSNLPLVQPDGQPFNLIDWLKALPPDQTYAEVTVAATDDPQRRPLRLVAGRLPPDKAEQAQAAVRASARQEHREVNPNTLLAAGFCLLLTNLPAPTWPSLLVLALYRVRWQIEWCFRRWKSLCHLDELPGYPSELAEPVLLAKLIIMLLMQRQVGALPWRTWWAANEPAPVVSSVVVMAYLHWCEIIRPAAVILQLLKDPTPFLRHLRSSRRKRPL
jgi:hypothetical protein